MSQTFNLCCPATQQYVWIGHGWGAMTGFYTGEPQTMQRLQAFLNAHRGEILYFLESEEMFNTSWAQGDDWHEYGLPENEQ